ncbi:MAG TPA: SDR family NAD(P)-dependent oxidoreductase [Pirellula sp.]|nr:SDR family NAD(P)-dependent oxidoreductase [Pirellula sp.]
MNTLQGKVAIITGAGGGIGREYALLFAAEGAKVVVNDIGCEANGSGQSPAAEQVVAEIIDSGGQAIANNDPVGSFASAGRIVKAALDAYGHLDILVNNAGILRDRTLLKMTEEEWNQVIEVHLTGSFSCMQAAARVMTEQRTGGRIINTSSSSGLLGNFGQTNYGAAKAGIHALTRIAAMELAKHKITVNAIAPAALTRMFQTMRGAAELVTLDTFGPKFIAPLAAYLASDGASNVSGQTFGIEGQHVFIYKMMISHGVSQMKGQQPWTIEELGQAISQIIQW